MRRVEIKTGYGIITLELDEQRAPSSAGFFLDSVESGVYRQAHFYRVVRRNPQAGQLPTIDILQGGLGWDRCDEVAGPVLETTQQTGLKHENGTISLARSAPDVSSPEFFICIGDQPKLDYAGTEGAGYDGFAAFGKVVEGMDVVEALHQLPANSLPPNGDERFRNEFLDDAVELDFRMV